MSLALCTTCTAEVCEPTGMGSLLSKVEYRGSRISPIGSNSGRMITCPSFSALACAANFEESSDCNGPEHFLSARTSVRTEGTDWTANADGDSMIEESATLSAPGLGTEALSPSTPVHDETKPSSLAKQFACCRVRTKCGFPKVFYWRHLSGLAVPEEQQY
jgi:hypothetical protein